MGISAGFFRSVKYEELPKNIIYPVEDAFARARGIKVDKMDKNHIVIHQLSWKGHTAAWYPEVDIWIDETENETSLTAYFEQKKGDSIYLLIILGGCGIFELVLLALWLTGNLITPILFLFPLFFAGFFYLISLLSFRTGAHRIKKILQEVIDCYS